jgi:hypothetical protein
MQLQDVRIKVSGEGMCIEDTAGLVSIILLQTRTYFDIHTDEQTHGAPREYGET